MDGAFHYAMDNGMCLESEYPYNAKGGECEKSFVTNGDEIFGDWALQLGNDSCNDEVWLSSNQLIPFNSQKLILSSRKS